MPTITKQSLALKHYVMKVVLDAYTHFFRFHLKDRISGGFKILISKIISEYIYSILDLNPSSILYNFNTMIISEESFLWGNTSKRD